MILVRVGGPLWLGIIVTFWGIVATCFAALSSATGSDIFTTISAAVMLCSWPLDMPYMDGSLCWQLHLRKSTGGVLDAMCRFYVLRLLLGLAEAGTFPGLWYMLTQFYSTSEVCIGSLLLSDSLR